VKAASFFAPGRISIGRWARRNPAGYRVYAALAPRRDMMKMSFGPHNTCYLQDIVGRLDPQRVYKLHQLAGAPSRCCFAKAARYR
jgi:hypothetical protein